MDLFWTARVFVEFQNPRSDTTREAASSRGSAGTVLGAPRSQLALEGCAASTAPRKQRTDAAPNTHLVSGCVVRESSKPGKEWGKSPVSCPPPSGESREGAGRSFPFKLLPSVL